MTAPEKIWTSKYSGKPDMGYWQDVPLVFAGPGTEYTRSDLIPTAAYVAGLKTALQAMLGAVCGPTGFAEAVRQNSGHAYPWYSLDDAGAMSRAALSARPDAPDVRVVTVAQLDAMYDEIQKMRAIIRETKE